MSWVARAFMPSALKAHSTCCCCCQSSASHTQTHTYTHTHAGLRVTPCGTVQPRLVSHLISIPGEAQAQVEALRWRVHQSIESSSESESESRNESPCRQQRQRVVLAVSALCSRLWAFAAQGSLPSFLAQTELESKLWLNSAQGCQPKQVRQTEKQRERARESSTQREQEQQKETQQDKRDSEHERKREWQSESERERERVFLISFFFCVGIKIVVPFWLCFFFECVTKANERNTKETKWKTNERKRKV